MKAIGIIKVDLVSSPLGTVSRLKDELCGVPVLTRTLRRVCAANQLHQVVVVCPQDQFDEVVRLADGLPITPTKFDGPPFATQRTVRVARKWALESWRGGLGNSCFFDEHTDPALCLTVAGQADADAVVSIAAEAPLVDPRLIDDIVDHFRKEIDATTMVFAQTPPGLSAVVLSSTLLQELVQSGMSPGWVNSYRPDQPQRDMINVPACFRPPLVVQTASGRLTSDTRRGFELLQCLCDNSNSGSSAEEVCVRLASLRERECDVMPREIQIELTTEDQLAETILRPRGSIVGRRGPLSLDLLGRLLQDAGTYDDVLIVLGGFGEPLLHPQFEESLRLCRQANVFGLAVRTNGLALEGRVIDVMLEQDVDIVQVMLDANDAERYLGVHRFDGWHEVTRNIEALDQARQTAHRINPVVIASLTKARETVQDMESFYDRWLGFSGWVAIEGYSNHAGLVQDRRVMSMAPPRRRPCGQLRNRCTVLADGSVVACDQDFQGRHVIGNLNTEPLAEIWAGDRMQALRAAHRAGRYSHHPMCQNCEEWHRP